MDGLVSWINRLSEGLKKTADVIGGPLVTYNLSAESLDQLEEQLILADMGVPVASAIRDEMAAANVEKNIAPEKIKELLAEAIAKRLPHPSPITRHSPHIILMVGVNGNGKTTTIGKLAHQHVKRGEKVMMVAGDTFRAAAVEQLEQWASRAGCAFVRGPENADPAAVAYQGIERAIKEGVDTVFVDTAGRLHTKQNLMDELGKIIRVIKKLIPDAPHEVLQVIDATTGQNAVAQIKAFREVAGVTGLVITKLDGTAKAGIVVAVAEQFKLPITAIGVGEGAEDLQPFEPLSFARALVGL